MAEDDNTRHVGNVKIPTILSLRDVFLMMTAVVSVMVAWGMYGTRLSVVEERMVTSKLHVTEIRQMIKDIREDTDTDQNEKHARINVKMEQIEIRLRAVETSFIRIEGLIKHQ